MRKFYYSFFALLFLQGCALKQLEIADRKEPVPVEELKYVDIQEAASKCVQSLLDSGVLQKKDGSIPFVMVGNLDNSILPHINTNVILQDIRLMIITSDQAVTMPAPKKKKKNTKSKPEDNSKLPTFDFLLSGEIVKEKMESDDDEKECCSLNLKLTDLKTKLVIWEDDEKLLR